MEEFVWTTRFGTEIPLSKINDNHLRNIERMMRSEMFVAGQISVILQGEMALLASDRQISAMEYAHDVICAEIKRRGLPL